MGDLTGRVPCEPAGQLGFFQQNRVLSPSFVAKMVGQATAHDPASNDDNASVAWEVL